MVLVQQVANLQYVQLWAPVPLVSRTAMAKQMYPDAFPAAETKQSVVEDDSWESWNRLRNMCECHPKLGVALELTGDLPSAAEMQRWLGEPVRCIVIPTAIFLTNRKGFPVLSKAHQTYVVKLFRHCGSKVLLRGRSKFDNGLVPYLEYMRHIYDTQLRFTPQQSFEAPYYDFLQAPLQPLMDNLESSTYEIFERDPVKYAQYQEAVYQALLDRTVPLPSAVDTGAAGVAELAQYPSR